MSRGLGDVYKRQVRAFTVDGASIVHVVDLAAARTGSPSPGLWRSIGGSGSCFQAAGGIRTADQARRTLDAGAARVVTGTTAVWDDEGLRSLHAAAGDRLVAAVDVRDDRAVGAGWTDEGRGLDRVLSHLEEAGVARLMVTSIATDGMLTGPDLPLLQRVIERMRVPVIASGGVPGLDDVRGLRETGAEAVVIGRALLEGRFSLADAIAAAR